MIRIHFTRLTFVILGLLVTTSLISAFAANIIVPTTRLTNQARAVTANDLKPAACSAINLAAVVVCTGGTCSGSGASELILGTSGNEIIKGKGGTDCIVGGGGDDDLRGNNGSDICIGGPGNDIFDKCEQEIQ